MWFEDVALRATAELTSTQSCFTVDDSDYWENKYLVCLRAE